jgi:hypothetical protein
MHLLNHDGTTDTTKDGKGEEWLAITSALKAFVAFLVVFVVSLWRTSCLPLASLAVDLFPLKLV